MAITYSDKKKQEWEVFKQQGGLIIFEIDAEDISVDRSFENRLSDELKTGFKLPPTSLIETPELQALIGVYGSDWDYILCRVYLSGGEVTYKQKTNGKYEAHCSV